MADGVVKLAHSGMISNEEILERQDRAAAFREAAKRCSTCRVCLPLRKDYRCQMTRCPGGTGSV